MMDNCSEVMQSEEFLNLDVDQLLKLLEKDNLYIRCESLIFQSVCNWAMHDIEVRRFHMDKILKYVHLHLLSPKFLKDQIENNELINMPNCTMSKQNMTNICDKLYNHEPVSQNLPTCRRPACTMYLIGGYHREPLKLIEKYDLKTGTWSSLVELETARSGKD